MSLFIQFTVLRPCYMLMKTNGNNKFKVLFGSQSANINAMCCHLPHSISVNPEWRHWIYDVNIKPEVHNGATVKRHLITWTLFFLFPPTLIVCDLDSSYKSRVRTELQKKKAFKLEWWAKGLEIDTSGKSRGIHLQLPWTCFALC